VVQKYIQNPLLIGGPHWKNTPLRKFDIRAYGLAQIIDGLHFRGYFYKEGYIRTSSYPYSSTDLLNRNIHLTNDAVQQYAPDYSKYEPGNKISYDELARYLDKSRGVDFYQ
jgi:tubulin--tyrosine ligase/tubulin polyglutamylase TTLL9